jgi:hypothetical protein
MIDEDQRTRVAGSRTSNSPLQGGVEADVNGVAIQARSLAPLSNSLKHQNFTSRQPYFMSTTTGYNADGTVGQREM